MPDQGFSQRARRGDPNGYLVLQEMLDELKAQHDKLRAEHDLLVGASGFWKNFAGVHVYDRVANQSVATAAQTTMLFDTLAVSADPQALLAYNPATGQFTSNFNVYLAIAAEAITTSAAAGNRLAMAIINGAERSRSYMVGGLSSVSTAAIGYLPSGTSANIDVFQDSGGNINYTGRVGILALKA